MILVFSCLSGNGKNQSLELAPGKFFTSKTLARAKNSFENDTLSIILDDLEPARVWGWTVPQAETTGWCDLIAQEAETKLPSNWKIRLWSQIENPLHDFESVVDKLSAPKFALHRYKLSEHMRRFPNQKLVGKVAEVVVRRLAHYSLQGLVLEKKFPDAVLLQTEEPRDLKTSLFQPLRTSKLQAVSL